MFFLCYLYHKVLYYTVQYCICVSVKGNQALVDVYKRIIRTPNIKHKITE